MRALAPTLFVIVSSIAAAGAAGCHKSNAADAPKVAEAAPVKVPVVTATAQSTPDVLALTGTIAANQRSEVTADTQGKVLGVMVERGQRVKMGEPVVRLDVRNAALSAQEAVANVAQAKATRQNAEDECRRSKQLLDTGAITKSDYDKQSTTCETALSQLTAAEARAAMSSKSVSDGMVRAPFSGMVAEKDVAPGEWVTPGKTLFTMVDDSVLKIELSVPESAVPSVKQDEQVELKAVAFPDKRFTAKVSRIGAEIDKTRSLIVEAIVDPGSPLVPGMFVEANLVTGHSTHPVIPASAVVKRGRTQHAFVVVKDHLVDRIVQLGAPPAPDQVTVLNGIKADEQVVSQVNDAIVDGLHVEAGAAATTTPPAAPPAAAPAPAAGSASGSGTGSGSGSGSGK